jgi:hypothetical protein
MNAHPSFVAGAVLLVPICGVCFADSPGTQLTRENIDKQPLLFRIATADAGNRIRFFVTVKPKTQTARPKLAVWLNVFDGKTPILNCPLAGEQRKDAVTYEFLIARKYLDASLLQISGGPNEDVPESGNYYFVLQDFASSTDVDGDK